MSAECYECGGVATAEFDIYRRGDTGAEEWWEALCDVCGDHHQRAGHDRRPLE